MIMDTTVDNTGLSINVFIIIKIYLNATLIALAMLSKGTKLGDIGVLFRRDPTPWATIFSPASAPDATTIIPSTRSATSMIEETATESPCTLYTYTFPCCSNVADSGTTTACSKVLGIMILPLLPFANRRLGLGNLALKLTVPVEVLTCPVTVSILPFSSYTLPLTMRNSTSGKFLIFSESV